MRVLFLTSRVPFPVIGGDRSRVFHFIRTLAHAGHDVHLVTFAAAVRPRPIPRELTQHLASHRAVPLPAAVSALQAFGALAGRRPLQVAYYDSRPMEDAVLESLARVKPDLVYTHLFRMAPYAIRVMERHAAAWVLDLTDVISGEMRRSLPYRRGANRWLYSLEGARIARYEEAIAPRFDRCWVISEAESRALATMAPSARIEVVPIGIEGMAGGASSRDPATVLFFGYQRIAHNRDAARFLATEVFPIVRRSVPGAILEIAGKGSDSLGRWARAPWIRNRGYVARPSDLFARAAVFVAPLRFGAGVQTKVLQAMDAGMPVVATPLVREGLEPVPEDILRVGKTPEEIAGHVIALLRDPSGAAALGGRGRAWVGSRFRWDHAVRAFENAAGLRPREQDVLTTVS